MRGINILEVIIISNKTVLENSMLSLWLKDGINVELNEMDKDEKTIDCDFKEPYACVYANDEQEMASLKKEHLLDLKREDFSNE